MAAAEKPKLDLNPTPKKKSPVKGKKKSPSKKLAVKADYAGIVFGKEEPPTTRAMEYDEDEPLDDPLASYRAAAKAAQEAAAKERKEEAQLTLFRKIFAAMDRNKDGMVEMADMVERVAASTARASAALASASVHLGGAAAGATSGSAHGSAHTMGGASTALVNATLGARARCGAPALPMLAGPPRPC